MKPFSFYLITDTHYFAPSLGCCGKAYDEFMQDENKCFAETSTINIAVNDYLCKAKDSDTILIPGDLVFNGEKQSHVEFLEILGKLKAAGKRVLVVTAGHDYNEHPFCFDENGRGEPEGTKREELFDLYYEYGFSDAISVHRESLSYITQLCEGVRLLALNNDGNYANNHTYTPSEIEWILRVTAEAKADGQSVIAMNHYPMIPATPIFEFTRNSVMPNHYEMTNMLADAGVHICFTGHMHNMSIKSQTSPAGNTFWDVCTSSIIAYPAQMRYVTITDPHTMVITSRHIPEFKWDTPLSNDEYLIKVFDNMVVNNLDWMETNPARPMGLLGINGDNEFMKNLIVKLGHGINTATLGAVAKKLHFRCPEEISDRSFRELMTEVLRNIFVGNEPYVEGTPECEFFMNGLDHFKPIVAIANKALSKNGNKADFRQMIKFTIGNYGVDEYNTTLSF